MTGRIRRWHGRCSRWARSRRSAGNRRGPRRRPAARHGKWQRDRPALRPNGGRAWRPPSERCQRRVGIHPDGVHERLGFTDDLFQCPEIGAAAGVVAVRNDEQCLLAMPAGLQQWQRLGDRVVQRRSAVRLHAAERRADADAIGRPSLHQMGRGVETIEKELVLRTEQVEEEPIERGARCHDLLPAHAATRVEHDAKAHRHALGAEVRDVDLSVVFIDDEVGLRQSGDETAGAIADGHSHVDEFDAGAKLEFVLPRRTALRHEKRHRARHDQRHSTANQVRHEKCSSRNYPGWRLTESRPCGFPPIMTVRVQEKQKRCRPIARRTRRSWRGFGPFCRGRDHRALRL